MPAPEIVHGQIVTKKKLLRAKELRQRMTVEEAILWERLRNNRLAGLHFRRQQVIEGFIVDFYCHSANLVVEIDGEIHDSMEYDDLRRDRVLAQKGLRVLRIRNDEVKANLDIVLAKILANALSPLPFREGGQGG